MQYPMGCLEGHPTVHPMDLYTPRLQSCPPTPPGNVDGDMGGTHPKPLVTFCWYMKKVHAVHDKVT